MMRICASLALGLMLTACQSENKADTAKAGGEVLPGSVSDAMLPLDTVRSQPPLAPKTGASGKADKDKPAGRSAASDAVAPTPSSSAATAEAPAAPPSGE